MYKGGKVWIKWEKCTYMYSRTFKKDTLNQGCYRKNLWGPLYNISTSKERKTCIKEQNGCCQKCALLRGSTLYQTTEERDENRKTQLEKGKGEPEVAGSL